MKSTHEVRLPKGWYAFGAAKEFSCKKPTAVRRFGLSLVVWKGTNGDWVAQLDQCPHRSARLSQGYISRNKTRPRAIVCPFHGMEFDEAGVCQFAPELGRGAPGIMVKSWKLAEQHQFLWIPWREPENSSSPAWFEELENGKFGYAETSQRWKAHFSRCVENQLDYAHLPFVHRNTIGRNFDPRVKVGWDLNEKTLKVILGPNPEDASYFEFRFPNVWRLVISSKVVQTLMFVPIDEGETQIYVRSYLASSSFPKISKWLAWISNHFNRVILNQDYLVVARQHPKNSMQAKEEQLLANDRAIVAFRRWMAEAEGNS